MEATRYSSTVSDRLSARLVVTATGCTEFMGARNDSGYGRIGVGRRGQGYALTHRVVWELRNGLIPNGLHVLHRCDNPPCCNIDHLFLGTHADNVADMCAKGRQRGQIPGGAPHPDARLTDEQVADLRSQHAAIGNYAELGRRFGVSKQHARALVLGMKRRSSEADATRQ